MLLDFLEVAENLKLSNLNYNEFIGDFLATIEFI